MKNILTIACAVFLMAATSCKAQDNVQLPKPSINNQVTLMQALQNRHSIREYTDKAIPDNVLSTVLWAACGINRPGEGKITAPSAINAQDILVYVVRKDGTYLYQPKDNSLQKSAARTCAPPLQAARVLLPVHRSLCCWSAITTSSRSRYPMRRKFAWVLSMRAMCRKTSA